MIKVLLITLLLVVSYSQSDQSENEQVSQLNELIAGLIESAHTEHTELKEAWVVSESEKTAIVQSFIQTKQIQINECDRRTQAIIDKNVEIEQTAELIQWIQGRTATNNLRIQTLEDVRCASAENFVNTIKENKIQLTVANFLRLQIQRVVDENGSYIQKSQAIKQITEFLQKLQGSQYDILNLQRDAEQQLDKSISSLLETGSGEDMSPFEYKRFNQEKNEVVLALNDIEDHVNANIPVGEQNMIRVGITLRNFIQSLRRENEFHGKLVQEQLENAENYRDQLVTLKTYVSQCETRLSEFDVSIQLSQEDLSRAEEQYFVQHEIYVDQKQLLVVVQAVFNNYQPSD